MTEIFLSVLNSSIVTSFLIIAVLVARLLLKNAPKKVRYIMWAMVGLRLTVPFSFESSLSLIPNAQKIDSTNTSTTTYIESSAVAKVGQTTNSINIEDILSYLWLIGIAAMVCYMIVSYIKVYRAVRESVHHKDNIWLCDHISSPFVLGVIKPKIFIHSDMNDHEQEYIIAHEQAHINHHDNIFKPLAFVLLSIHWFNPLCHLAYRLFVKDIELYCDESVIKTLDSNGKKEYSSTLLLWSINSTAISRCPLAFSEDNIKDRVKSILSYKKPTIYIAIGSMMLCVAVYLLFMTNPVGAVDKTKAVEQTTTESVTVASTQVETEQPTEKPTQAPTEKPTQAETQAPTEEVFYESDTDYDYNYDTTTSVPFVPFRETDAYKNSLNTNIWGNSYSSSNNNSNSYSEPKNEYENPDGPVSPDKPYYMTAQD